MRHGDRVGGPVQQYRFERCVFYGPDVSAEIGCGEVLSGHQRAAAFLELDQERQVGVAAHIVDEERNPVADEAFRQDHVAHRHRQRAVGAGRTRHPFVGELGVVGVVGADADHLGAAVAHLGHPVCVGRAGDRDVGAPHHQVRRVPPVAGLRHVGLVAEHLRRGHRQVGIPVVERRHHPAEQFDEPGSGRVADHRHRRDRREAGDPVRAVLLDRVHVGGRDHLGGLGPGHPHQAALAAGPLVAAAALGIGLDVGPRQHRIAESGLGFPVHLDEQAAGVRVPHPGRRVGVPRERRAARAAAGLVLGPVRAHRRVVGLLGFPGDDAVLDVDLPRARPGAVHAVGGADHLVVAPPVSVEHIALAAALASDGAQVVGELARCEEAPAALEQFLDPAARPGCGGHVGASLRRRGSCACRRSAVYANATSAVATSSSSPIV